ncbi:hypothetical protein [Aeoliella sp. SH292]|uniref:hypothetical protein n=1 Tax=Aeoliella sp. SH292 TaxID=3454464 RepID=UPI003F9BF33E
MSQYDYRWDPVEVMACLEVEPQLDHHGNDPYFPMYHYSLIDGEIHAHVWIDSEILDVGVELKVAGKLLLQLRMSGVARIERHCDLRHGADELRFLDGVGSESYSNLPEGFILRRKPHLQVILGARG